MSAPRLLAREIQHVPEQPADGRAHDVEDAKGRAGGVGVARGRHQKKRSLT
jgi:hypothetical protein